MAAWRGWGGVYTHNDDGPPARQPSTPPYNKQTKIQTQTPTHNEKGCADILVQDDATGEVLLVRRTGHPQPDWWFLGGRMRAGESPLDAARRNLAREAGLDIAPGRLAPLCVVSMLWERRRQPPARNGTADVSVVFVTRATAAQRAAVVLDPNEHSAVAWVAPEALAAGDQYHPVLRR